ncbi:MAG: hypothetical protein H7Z16_14780 [Pyrinomonadaceae bacterium]|nr:hypothetical protein [Pyrinomonadaceae bacterium]
MRWTSFRAALLILILLTSIYPQVWARSLPRRVGVPTIQTQTKPSTKPVKLPSADKVVEAYLKAIGGKKRVAAIRDANYEWNIALAERPVGIARTQIRSPGSFRSEITVGNGQVFSAANAGSAWSRGIDGSLRTLTGEEAKVAKLQALLDASHLVDYKKLNVLARTLSAGEMDSEPIYIVEFSTRNGARLRYSFSVNSRLLVKIEDETRQTSTRLGDYRPLPAMANVLEPHRLVVTGAGNTGAMTFLLERAIYNQGLSISAFDPPRAAETVDVVKLLREVARNQDELEKRFTEYSFLQKETDREINSKGELKKETIKVFEVFPVPHRAPVMKLISENGVSLAGERLAKETKRVDEEFEKVERDKDKNQQRAEKNRAERQRKKARTKENADSDDDVDISQFLKVHEFVSPRVERFRDRDAVVFDFRVRQGFKPGNREEDLISKLVGVAWIDPADKQVMRLEAKLAEGFKMAGGLLVNLRPGAAFMMEQTRMAEGVWLPRLAQINLSVKVLLFGGGDFNKTIEWSDYRHFAGDVKDFKLEPPKTSP